MSQGGERCSLAYASGYNSLVYASGYNSLVYASGYDSLACALGVASHGLGQSPQSSR